MQVSRVADQAKRGGSKDFMGVMSQYQSNNGFLSGLEEEEDNISKIVGKYLKHDLPRPKMPSVEKPKQLKEDVNFEQLTHPQLPADAGAMDKKNTPKVVKDKQIDIVITSVLAKENVQNVQKQVTSPTTQNKKPFQLSDLYTWTMPKSSSNKNKKANLKNKQASKSSMSIRSGSDTNSDGKIAPKQNRSASSDLQYATRLTPPAFNSNPITPQLNQSRNVVMSSYRRRPSNSDQILISSQVQKWLRLRISTLNAMSNFVYMVRGKPNDIVYVNLHKKMDESDNKAPGFKFASQVKCRPSSDPIFDPWRSNIDNTLLENSKAGAENKILVFIRVDRDTGSKSAMDSILEKSLLRQQNRSMSDLNLNSTSTKVPNPSGSTKTRNNSNPRPRSMMVPNNVKINVPPLNQASTSNIINNKNNSRGNGAPSSRPKSMIVTTGSAMNHQQPHQQEQSYFTALYVTCYSHYMKKMLSSIITSEPDIQKQRLYLKKIEQDITQAVYDANRKINIEFPNPSLNPKTREYHFTSGYLTPVA